MLDDLAKVLNTPPPTEQLTAEPGAVRVLKYMLQIELYPSGKVYPKLFPIGESRKNMRKKKKKLKTLKLNEDVKDHEIL